MTTDPRAAFLGRAISLQCNFYSDGTSIVPAGIPGRRGVQRCAFMNGHGGDCRFPLPGQDLTPEIRLRAQLDQALASKRLEEPKAIETFIECLSAIEVAIDRALEHPESVWSDIALTLYRRAQGLSNEVSVPTIATTAAGRCDHYMQMSDANYVTRQYRCARLHGHDDDSHGHKWEMWEE